MSLVVRRLSCAVAVALWLSSGGAAFAQSVAGTPIGPTERVHPLPGGVTVAPAVATTPYGHQLLVYTAETPQGLALLGKISPSPQGLAWPNPLVITQHDWLGFPAVAMSQYGYFVAAWERGLPNGDAEGVYARFFDMHGQARGDEFKVNLMPGTDHDSIVAAANVSGTRYLIAWKNKDASGVQTVRAQMFDGDMQRVGPEQRIDTTGTEAGIPISVAMPKGNTGGPAYVVWTGNAQTNPTFPGTIYLRTVSEDGSLGTPIVVAAQMSFNGSTMFANGASVDTSWDSSIAVAWKTEIWGSDGSRTSRINTQRYSSDLQPLGGMTTASEVAPTSYGVSSPIVGMDFEGEQWVGWESRQTNTSPASLKARLVPHFGEQPAAFVVEDSATGGNNVLGRIATDTDGGTIFAWTRINSDGSLEALQRRYRGHYRYTPVAEALPTAGPINYGDTAEFMLRVVSPGSGAGAEGYSTVTGVRLDLELPAGAELIEAGGNAWTCTGSGVVECRYDDVLLGGGSTQYLPVSVRAPLTSQMLELRGVAIADQALTMGEVVATVQVADLSPDAPTFASVADVARGSEQISAAVTIGGIDAPVAISTINGQYSVNGGAFTQNVGQVVAGDSVRLRHTAAATFSTDVVTTLWVGDASATFQSTTLAADTSPDAFAFAPVSAVARNVLQTSDEIVVTGINATTSISVVGGSFSIDGGAFSATARTVEAGQRVRVQHTSAAAFSTATSTTLTIGDASAAFVSTTEAADTSPDAFAFAPVNGVVRNALQTSNEIVVAGINTTTPISVAGGSFSIDGGAFSATARTIEAGQRVRVQHTSAAAFSTTTSTTLTIGDGSAAFASTTEAMDATPAAFSFADQTGVATGSAIVSAPITVAGINTAVAISISGGSYSINGAAFTSAAGTVQSGDQVRVQHTSSANALTAVNSTLTIGGVTDTFTSTTGSSDTTPNAFTFTDVTGARRGRSIDSNTITISGINATVNLSIAGSGATYSKNNGTWTSAPGTARSGDTLRLRMTASATSNTTVTTTVTVGGVSDTWSVTSGTK